MFLFLILDIVFELTSKLNVLIDLSVLDYVERLLPLVVVVK